MDQPRTWTRFLDWAEYWYNTAYHTSAGMTPFEIVYGRIPPNIPRYILDSSKNDAVDKELRQRDEILQQLRYNLERAQNRMKNIADKHRTDREFKVGELVWLRLQPYKQRSAKGGPSHKLSKRFYGPFPILERVGAVAYRLQLSSVTKIHPVFHVSLLKKFVGDPSLSPKDLPEIFADSSPVLQPQKILASREILVNDTKVFQKLVQWEGLQPEEATWEDQDSLPSNILNLEDKVPLIGGSNDTQLREHTEHMSKPLATTRMHNRIRRPPKHLEDFMR